jgi:predicted ATP-grasp superfamily ATP-dependent carboligase
VVHLEGWIDAGGAAQAAVAHLLDALDERTEVASFDVDVYCDQRARRPVMHLVEGQITGFTDPAIELTAGVLDGRDVLVLHGVEPDDRWRAFTSTVVELVVDAGVTLVVGMGAYPAAVPHTRAPRLSITSAAAELVERHDLDTATLDVPAGVAALIEYEAFQRGIPSMALWAQIPHYTSGMPYPAASVALLEQLGRAAGVRIDATALREDAIAVRGRIDQLVSQRSDHAELVARLEDHYDASARADDTVPSGDELAAELEDFLRRLDE